MPAELKLQQLLQFLKLNNISRIINEMDIELVQYPFLFYICK